MEGPDEGAATSGDWPSLVVVCGEPGVGKSRVARAIGDRLSATVYRTDEVRAERYDEPTYDTGETEHVYTAVCEQGIETVAAGGRAVLDGTYRQASLRAEVIEAAGRAGVEPLFVRVECAEPVVRERIDARTDDASDAGIEEYYQIRAAFDPLSRDHVTVDNSGEWVRTREQLQAAFPQV